MYQCILVEVDIDNANNWKAGLVTWSSRWSAAAANNNTWQLAETAFKCTRFHLRLSEIALQTTKLKWGSSQNNALVSRLPTTTHGNSWKGPLMKHFWGFSWNSVMAEKQTLLLIYLPCENHTGTLGEGELWANVPLICHSWMSYIWMSVNQTEVRAL